MRFRPTSATVDLEAIRHNVRELKPARSELMAVVKADAYGHGAAPVARAALSAGATWLGVAIAEEGIVLRDAGIRARILVLSELTRGSEKDALAADLTPTVYTPEGLVAATSAARSLGTTPVVHVKVDTGMHRVGLEPATAAGFVSDAGRGGVRVEGVWTHLASADDPGDPSISSQLDRFDEVLSELDRNGMRARYRHAANSAATITLPRAHLDLVRVGIAMYGLAPSARVGRGGLRASMRLASKVSFVKRVAGGEGISYGLEYRLSEESTIATVPIGYADGYPRAASGHADVLIRGRRYPVAGTVTMDQITVDVGDDRVEPGDEVVLFGAQGSAEVTADELAAWAGTIGYEVVCGISGRVPRDYVGEA